MPSRDERIRVVIVDDERPVRASLRGALAQLSGVEIVAECSGGADAIEAIRREEPDVVFLDISMPEIDGFDVVAEIGPHRMPPVIFVTAHDVSATRAFEAAAIDYVLKPFKPARIARALERLPHRPRDTDLADQLRELLEARRTPEGHARRIMVQDGDDYRFVAVETIYWIEADGKYVRLHTDEGEYRIRETLRAIHEALDPDQFARVHRSSIVDFDRIQKVEPWFGGTYLAFLDTGEKVRVSRNRARELLRTLS